MLIKSYKLRSIFLKNCSKYCVLITPLGRVYIKLYTHLVFIKKSYLIIVNIDTYKYMLRRLFEYRISGLRCYSKMLELYGLGYVFSLYSKENILRLEGGCSHKIFLEVGQGIVLYVEKKRVLIYSISKKRLSHTVMLIKMLKRRDVYKGKGIRMFGEILKLKIGKRR